MSSKLIDVSEFQSTIDWKKVKASGINYAIIRVGGRFGVSGKIYEDSKFSINIKNAINSGIKVGVYFFTQAVNTNEAIQEARYTLDKIKGYTITLPVYIDTEWLDSGRHNNITRRQRTDVCKAFCEEIKKNGYNAGVYASTSWANNNLIMSELPYSIWIAQYYKECQYKGSYDIWQYSSSGSVSGISGNCDMNILYKIYEEKSYTNDIKVKAVDVLLGKYGNGEERVKKLGADYKEVQSLVNLLLERLGL